MQENEAIQTEEQEPTEVVELEEEVKESESEQSAAPIEDISEEETRADACLLYTSPSPRDVEESRMPSSA